jgi:hypothetical protein
MKKVLIFILAVSLFVPKTTKAKTTVPPLRKDASTSDDKKMIKYDDKRMTIVGMVTMGRLDERA